MSTLQLCVIGDGLACGLGDPFGAGWVGRLCALEARRHGEAIEAFKVGSATATSLELADHWRSEADFRLPGRGALLFQFGAMDMALDQNEPDLGVLMGLTGTLFHARRMLAEAALGRRTLWVGPAPVLPGHPVFVDAQGRSLSLSNDRLVVVNEAFAALARDLKVPYLDVFEGLQGEARWTNALLQTDGIHPGPDGHLRLAQLVSDWWAWRAWLAEGQRKRA